MGIKSIIMVAVLALSSTSFASNYTGVAAGPKAPCPKMVAMMKAGMKGLLGWSSSAQQQFNSRVLASNTSGSRKQAPSAPVSGTQGNSIR